MFSLSEVNHSTASWHVRDLHWWGKSGNVFGLPSYVTRPLVKLLFYNPFFLQISHFYRSNMQSGNATQQRGQSWVFTLSQWNSSACSLQKYSHNFDRSWAAFTQILHTSSSRQHCQFPLLLISVKLCSAVPSFVLTCTGTVSLLKAKSDARSQDPSTDTMSACVWCFRLWGRVADDFPLA